MIRKPLIFHQAIYAFLWSCINSSSGALAGLLKNPVLTKDDGLIKYGIFDIR